MGSGHAQKIALDRTMTVLKIAAQKLVAGLSADIAGKKHGGYRRGAMPSDSGNMMRSLMGSTSFMPQAVDEEAVDHSKNIGAAILNWQRGQTLWLGYTVAYAPRMNYGFIDTDSKGRKYNQTGYFFVEKGTENWPSYLKEAENELPPE